MRDSLLYIAQGAEGDGRGVNRDVEMLEASMSGAGTKDERLYVPFPKAYNDPRLLTCSE